MISIFAAAVQSRMAIKNLGRLAQLVQSTWFTPKGSGVRISHRPLLMMKELTEILLTPFLVF